MIRRLILFAVFTCALAAGAALAGPAQRITFESSFLGENRPLNIVLPRGYSPDGEYPVVYALDGDSSYITDLARRLQAARPDLIVVGVENVDRSRDMFPDALKSRRGRGGGGKRFYRFLVDELVPYVERKYAAGGDRILSGQSNSGFFVLYALQRDAKAFDGYLALSPMAGWDWPMLRDGFTELLEDKGTGPVGLYMNEGETDLDHVKGFMPRFTELLGEMAPAGFRWRHDLVEGGDHVPTEGYARGVEFLLGEAPTSETPSSR